MINKFIVGITGPSGAGKTTACKILSDNGCFCISADEVSRKVLSKNSECLKKLVNCFGLKILDSNSKIDRKMLAAIAFSNDLNSKKLNDITHPYIVEEILKIIKFSDNKLLFLDVPLLFESGLNNICDFIISIISDENIRMKRVMKRDNLNESFINQRFLRQKNANFFEKNSDCVILNNSSEKDLCIKVLNIFKFFQEFIDGS